MVGQRHNEALACRGRAVTRKDAKREHAGQIVETVSCIRFHGPDGIEVVRGENQIERETNPNGQDENPQEQAQALAAHLLVRRGRRTEPR